MSAAPLPSSASRESQPSTYSYTGPAPQATQNAASVPDRGGRGRLTRRHGVSSGAYLALPRVETVFLHWQLRLPDPSYASPALEVVSEDKCGTALA
jgi:hypothetical protein